jgi:dTDP-glucose 4,6-dehydratase
VIGSNSFSGGDFIALLLERGYEVAGVSRSEEKSGVFLPYKRHGTARFRFHRLDLNKDKDGLFGLLSEFRPDYVVNFAAQSEVAPSWTDPGQWFRTNAVAVADLGDFLRKQNWLKKYVHISSPEVYGTCSGTVKEDAPLNPSTPYAASKAAGDLFLFTLVKNYSFPLVMIRATNVYGARQQLFKIIPRTVISIKSGRTIELHGGGKAVKSYIHIRDVSRGELSAMEAGRPGLIYHLSPDAGISVRDLVAKICARMGADFGAVTRKVGERPGQDAAYVIDSGRARSEFGWKPEVPLEEGLGEVVDWVEKEWEEIRRLPLEYAHKE